MMNRRLCGVFCVVWKLTRREDYHGHAATCVCILLGGFRKIREKPDWRIFTGIIKSDVFKLCCRASIATLRHEMVSRSCM